MISLIPDQQSDSHVRGLAILAARGAPMQARAAWESLLRMHTFEQLPNEVIRAMPQIYLNQRLHEGLPEMRRLRGVYQAFWSSNLSLLAACGEVLSDLYESGIPYRVIKGGAICGMTGTWGGRRMGDIDVVVPDDHVTAAVHTLRERGFAPRIVDGSEHGWARAAHQGTFVSDSGGLVDLHSPAGHPRVFSDLFDEPGQLVRALDRPLWVPSNEASLTIAVWHALKSTASSDRVQALLDMSALLPLVDPERARTLLLRSDLNRPASDLLSELRDLDLLDATSWQAIDRIGPGEHLVRWKARWRRFTNKCKRVSSLPKVLWRRRLTIAERQSLQVLRGPRARLYMVWSQLGQIRALERALHVAIGGFGDLGPAGGPIPQRDFRATLPTRRGIRRTLIVHFTFDEGMGEPPHRLLFIDGLLHGTVPLPGNVPGRYEVMPDRDQVEVSARHLSSTTPSIVQTVRIEWA